MTRTAGAATTGGALLAVPCAAGGCDVRTFRVMACGVLPAIRCSW